jgi:hypothetical protein
MGKRLCVLVTGIVLAVLVACDSPSGPSTPPPPPPPPPPSNPAVDMRIEAPASVAPGTSVQLRLIATFRDGTSSDVASQATWTTDNPSVLSFSPPGVANGGERGEVHLSARYQTLTRHAHLFVLEDGTFRLSGRAIESGVGLPDARIEVVAGTGRGLATTTRSDGSYALFGVAGDVQLETTLDGFERTRQTVVVNGHTTANLELRPSVAPTDLRGEWRLTLGASTGCVPAVPEDATTRSYIVTIEQAGTVLQFAVKPPAIVDGSLPVSGRVVDRQVTMSLPFHDYYYGFRYYAIVERLQPARLLAIAGTGKGQYAGAAVEGAFSGEFALYTNESFGGLRNQISSCQRGDHGFRLERN